MRYYAIRPITTDRALQRHNTRIERAHSPIEAFRKAYGRGYAPAYEWKDCGAHHDQLRPGCVTRDALLTSPEGWNRYTKVARERLTHRRKPKESDTP